LLAVLALAVVGGSAYYYGTKVGEERALQNPQQLFQQMGQGQGGRFGAQGQFPVPEGTPLTGGRGMQMLGGGLRGTVEQIDGNTLVLSTDTEGSVRVQTSDTTLVEKYMSVEVADLVKGEQLIVVGTQNEDGSYSARSIQSLRAAPLTGTDSGQGR